MKKDENDLNYVNVNHVLDHMEMTGESYSDVVSFWEAFRRSVELELEDENSLSQLSDIFDCGQNGAELGNHAAPLQIAVEGTSSVQEGVEKALGS